MEKKAAYEMRAAIAAYWDLAKRIRGKIEADRALYVESILKDLMADYNRQLLDGKGTALDAIYAARDRATAEISAWATLRGEDITPDAQLLSSGIQLTADELRALADKYRGNYTMMRVIRDYWREHITGNPGALDVDALDAQMPDEATERIDSIERLAVSAAQLVQSIYQPDQTDPVRLSLMDQIVEEWGLAYIETARG